MLCQNHFTFLTDFSWRVTQCDNLRDPKRCLHGICVSCDAVVLVYPVPPHSSPILMQLVCCPERESSLAGKKACEYVGCECSRYPECCLHGICVSCDALALLHLASPHILPLMMQLIYVLQVE